MNYELLRATLNYDPVTGKFTWLIDNGKRCWVGKEAGSVNREGYRIIRINKKAYRSARLAFLYMVGVWPLQMDHINGIKDDDRWSNLREATVQQNIHNKGLSKRNSTGYKGVTLRHNGKYEAAIVIGKVYKRLGYYSTPEEAGKAYEVAAREFHKEFARVK